MCWLSRPVSCSYNMSPLWHTARGRYLIWQDTREWAPWVVGVGHRNLFGLTTRPIRHHRMHTTHTTHTKRRPHHQWRMLETLGMTENCEAHNPGHKDRNREHAFLIGICPKLKEEFHFRQASTVDGLVKGCKFNKQTIFPYSPGPSHKPCRLVFRSCHCPRWED